MFWHIQSIWHVKHVHMAAMMRSGWTFHLKRQFPEEINHHQTGEMTCLKNRNSIATSRLVDPLKESFKRVCCVCLSSMQTTLIWAIYNTLALLGKFCKPRSYDCGGKWSLPCVCLWLLTLHVTYFPLKVGRGCLFHPSFPSPISSELPYVSFLEILAPSHFMGVCVQYLNKGVQCQNTQHLQLWLFQGDSSSVS